MTIVNHGSINVFMLQAADIIVVGGQVVVVTDTRQRLMDGKPVYDFHGVVTTADAHGNVSGETRQFIDFTASASFPRLLVTA